MPYKINPFTSKFDDITLDTTAGDARYLKLDQTTPQTVSGGAPIFGAGLKANSNIVLRTGYKMVFDGT